ncbi:SpoVK/Ycf46/Vps4 family AAA+-type ATPase [Microbacterium sp. SORGH_AS428]|uniref:ATP-binding protein n=1 Tax=Microbacterium sp. SORGH_AS_0428 TaxID=3041788 RepID=UPI0028598BE9|nr:ATP-binding protein [Microbacterium sp. SORGH_AS_0428]MDR6200719.1 SpoVK/Ycf46/Vps4 family AAA+-type ATPase [Microbacterium sp. SORGH_AS_0428]
MEDPVIDALARAVAAAPADAELRLHLATVLLDRGHTERALAEASTVLAADPGNARAREMLARILQTPAAPEATAPVSAASDSQARIPTTSGTGFDWSAAEAELDHIAQPMFVGDGAPAFDEHDVQRPTVTLSDVGGMREVKERLESAFLAPLRNPELRALYGKSLRGGLLMYGPPGCGKTFLARAVAGELGAAFVSVGLSDILGQFMGDSERNVRELFRLARRQAPTVLFIDEIDAIGQRRSLARQSGMRGVVVSLLEELDGLGNDNEGVFVLAATNQPWDVDPALRRPGRLDRTLLVLPPDAEARQAILRHHLAGRPVEGVDLASLAAGTEGFSGADLAYVCELASENALLESSRSGVPRLIGMSDLRQSVAQITPSTGPWLESARNVVRFGEDDGTFAQLREYLRQSGRR